MLYLINTPWWLRKAYGGCTWHLPTKEKILYLTFDDGPHPEATTFVLDTLSRYHAKATFFCIGKNVVEQPILYSRILDEGHRVGNHTHNHLNGWKVDNDTYFKNITEARKHIDSDLFRPPYGRISPFQIKLIKEKLQMEIIMWSVLSGDFDPAINEEKCLRNVVQHGAPGKMVVFHDSAKALQKLTYCLPRVLQHFSEKGYRFESIGSGMGRVV